MIVDYHMHLRDRHGDEPGGRYTLDRLERHVDAARAAGVDEIGITDHAYHFRQTESLWNLPWLLNRGGDDLEEYVAAIEEGKQAGLPVKLGIEMDWFAGLGDGIAEMLAPYPWDYVLGSIHFIGELAVDQDPALVDAVPLDEAWRAYFDTFAEAARSGIFDVLSHPDLVKFYGQRADASIVEELHDQAATAAAEGGVALEVSTAGLQKPVGELYPDVSLLRAARGREVPITLAADAHLPEEVGRDIELAVALAREAGYETVTVFDGRTGRQEPLG